mgnify:CR=1 FL=1|jgi:hypothetical protein
MSDYTVVNLSKYTSPEIIESRNKEWIEYGSDNNYFQYLIDRYIGSTTNNSIINGIANQIYGKGISATDSSRRPEQFAQMISLFKKQDLRRFIKDKKMLGMASFQISYDKGKIVEVSHFPMNTLRSEKANKDGDIEAWYYHPDWDDIKPSDNPKRINAFGFGNKKGNELFVLKSYVAGFDYYSPVDYVGALPYAVLEEEIADYLINDTLNGFSGTKVINFNNGVPDEEKRKQVKNDVLKKLTGARGEKVIVAFNSNKESETTVTDLPLNDAPAHYQYLSEECRSKLIVGHRVTSPMLIGVRETGGGLGNNADEIKTASLLFDNITINSMQEEITDAMDTILAVNDISLNLYFKTLQPLDFINTDGMNADAKEEATGGVTMSSDNDLISKGEILNEEWLLIDETEVDYDGENDYDLEIEELNKTKLSFWQKFITARPNSKSDQDKTIDGVKFITRYKYAGSKTGERKFCNDLINADKVYRKEDIVNTDSEKVNKGQGHDGQKYDIFLYKGGVNCHHKWFRQTFMSAKNTNIDVKNPNVKTISRAKAETLGYKVRNDKEVATEPRYMPNNGHHPNYKG